LNGVPWAELDVTDTEADRLAAEHRDSLRLVDGADDHGIRANLPEAFWTSRPVLGHIRQAAHSRARSADAVLGCVLARVAAMTPPSFNLPAIAGAYAPLSTYVAIVGAPGTGKSSSSRLASELLRCDNDAVADDLPLGSGEGLIECFFDLVEDTTPTGKPRLIKRQTRHGAFVFLDEGQVMSELGNRRGSTLMPMLRTAWSGATLGTTNASIETRRRLPAGSYSLGLVVAFQPAMAADLLGDAAGGTPQRFMWVSATDPTIPDEQPPWPGALTWQPPQAQSYNGAVFTATLGVAETVRRHVHAAALQRTRGAVDVDELDAHADLARLKVAGLFAVLDERQAVTEADWDLAGQFQRTSRGVRTVMVETISLDARKRDETATRRYVDREGAVLDSQVSKATERMAGSMARHVHKQRCGEHCTRRCLTSSTASGDRHRATIESAIERALELKWIVVAEDQYRPGKACPT
jgi:hypothetical protein